ncbi:MAG: XdhC family protein [Chthoniobacteraceae bacterium]
MTPDASTGLATIVRATHGEPGAMMLYRASGESERLIGAGSFPKEVADAVRKTLASDSPKLLTLETDSGPVKILAEKANPHFLQVLAAAQQEKQALVVVSVFEMGGDHRQKLRTLALIDETGRWRGLERDRTEMGRLWDACREALQDGRSRVQTHHLGDGIATTFLRVIHPSE